MKKTLIITLVGLLLIACKKKEDATITDSWQLTEQYMGTALTPGVPTTYVPVNSSKKVFFWSNETVSSNGTLCYASPESNNPSSGTFNASNKTITPENCENPVSGVTYSFEGENLIISYPCYEGCFEKYVKIP